MLNSCPRHDHNIVNAVCEKCKRLVCNSCRRVEHNNHRTFIFESSLLSEYRFISYLGKGSFGKVFKVSNPVERQEYALKVIDDVSVEDSVDYLSELLIHRELKDPNIIEFHSFKYIKENENRLAILLELADSSLDQKVKSLSQKQAYNLFVGICRGINFLHSNGIIHRDLKLANILVKNNVAKIADFGQSILSSETMRSVSTFGTKMYWPPEVIKGQDYNEKTDIWSLGIIFHKILAKNAHPFDEQENKIINGEIEIHPSIVDPIYLEILKSLIFLI